MHYDIFILFKKKLIKVWRHFEYLWKCVKTISWFDNNRNTKLIYLKYLPILCANFWSDKKKLLDVNTPLAKFILFIQQKNSPQSQLFTEFVVSLKSVSSSPNQLSNRNRPSRSLDSKSVKFPLDFNDKCISKMRMNTHLYILKNIRWNYFWFRAE